MGSWDLLDEVSQRLVPHINGRRNLIELANLAHVDVAIGRLCLIGLIRLGLVRTLGPPPSFIDPNLVRSFPSIPKPGWFGLPRLLDLLTNQELAKACFDCVVVRYYSI